MRTIELLEQGSGRDVECSICNSQMHLSLLNRVGVRQVVPTLVGGAQWWQDSSTPTRRFCDSVASGYSISFFS